MLPHQLRGRLSDSAEVVGAAAEFLRPTATCVGTVLRRPVSAFALCQSSDTSIACRWVPSRHEERRQQRNQIVRLGPFNKLLFLEAPLATKGKQGRLRREVWGL